MASFQGYLDILNTNTRRPQIKIELLREEDETVYSEITADIMNSSGEIAVQRQNGVRQSIDLTLINIEGDYLPDFDNGIWWRNKFKASLGYTESDDSIFWHPMGVYCLENPIATSNYSEKTLQIHGIDKFSVMDGSLGGETDYTYIVPVGTNIYTAIQAVLTLVGDKKAPILDVVYKDEVTPYTIEIEIGGIISDVLIKLAEMVSAFVYYNSEGHLVFAKDDDDSEKASLYDFTTDEYNYMGANRTYKFNELYNAALVIGDNINGEIFDAKVQNNNLLSDVSIPNVGFERVKVINDANIYSDALAIERAKYELKLATALQSSISITCVSMFHLEVDSVITINDSSIGLLGARYLINGFRIPLNIGGSMSLDIVDVKEFEFDY